MWLKRRKIFKCFYNDQQCIWKDCGVNYSFFLSSLNYAKCINFEFGVAKAVDSKNPKKIHL